MAQDKYTAFDIGGRGGADKLTHSKWDATAAPGTGNDETQGYQRGSFWLVTSGSFAGQLFYCRDPAAGAAVWERCGPDPTGGGSGTVTSVGLALPDIFTVSGSPITTSGTLTGALANQDANKVWAGPTTGAAAAPTFRVLVAADLPTHTHPQSDVTNLVTDLAAKAPLASPALTGTPTAPTAAPGTNTTQLATTAFVTAAVAASPAGTVTSVDVSGGTTGLTTSGGPVTGSGTITLAGTLAIANGGTGQTTAAAAFGALKQAATETATGVVELATVAEAQAGTDTVRAVTPAGLRGAVRPKLASALALFVDDSGSDSNDGLSVGTPFLTKQKAVDTICSFDTNNIAHTITVGAGTYTGPTTLKELVGGGTCTITGAGAANTIVNVSTGNGFLANGQLVRGWTLASMKIQSTSHCVVATLGASITLGSGLEFGTCGSGYAHQNAQFSATISRTAGYTISGGGSHHLWTDSDGLILDLAAIPVVVSVASLAFTIFSRCNFLSKQQVGAMTFSGNHATVTGQRFAVTGNAVLDTSGGGASFFPGNSAGSESLGGRYL